MSGITFDGPVLLAAAGVAGAGPVGWGRKMVAVAAVALAVKLMDDVLDAPRDRVRGEPNWAATLGRAATPYAMVLLVLGTAAHAPLAAALFLAAYAWGMAGDRWERMPSGLLGWQESALAVAVSWAAAGTALTVMAVSLVGALHWADQWLDGGAATTGPPLVLPLAAAGLALVALAVDPWLFLGGALVGGAISWTTRPRRALEGPASEGPAPAGPAGEKEG